MTRGVWHDAAEQPAWPVEESGVSCKVRGVPGSDGTRLSSLLESGADAAAEGGPRPAFFVLGDRVVLDCGVYSWSSTVVCSKAPALIHRAKRPGGLVQGNVARAGPA